MQLLGNFGKPTLLIWTVPARHFLTHVMIMLLLNLNFFVSHLLLHQRKMRGRGGNQEADEALLWWQSCLDSRGHAQFASHQEAHHHCAVSCDVMHHGDGVFLVRGRFVLCDVIIPSRDQRSTCVTS